jgi:hypothetical protein
LIGTRVEPFVPFPDVELVEFVPFVALVAVASSLLIFLLLRRNFLEESLAQVSSENKDWTAVDSAKWSRKEEKTMKISAK